MSVENTSSQQSVSRETVTKEIEYVERDTGEGERIKQEYEEKIAEINVSFVRESFGTSSGFQCLEYSRYFC